MDWLKHPLVTSFGITIIILASFINGVISPFSAGLFYHWDGPVHVILVAIFLVILIVWILVTLLIYSVRNHPSARRFVWVLLAIVIVRELLEEVYYLIPLFQSKLTDIYVQYPPRAADVAYLIFVLALCLSLTVRSLRENPFWHKAKKFLIVLLGFAAISGFVTIYQLLLIGWTARNLNQPRQLRASSPIAASSPHPKRVVWLILDELSYDQVYDHRFPGLQLPEFDHLASQSTLFTQVVPAGMYTQEVLPSLIIGREYQSVNYHIAGPLSLQLTDSGRWEKLNPKDTVFEDAVDDGYRLGIAGWYNPYCRLFNDKLDFCYWDNTAPLSDSGLYRGSESTLQLTEDIFLYFLDARARHLHLHVLPPQGVWSPKNNILHLESYEKLVPQGDKALLDPALSFVFLHMPIPHPPGIYNRHTGKLSIDGTSYIDNLALADKYLGHIREELQANGTWDDTTIVIMGDHSWRTNIEWNHTAIWRPEDEVASKGGQFDSRPGYIVKLAGQTTPARIDTPFKAIRTRSLLNALMQGKITTPEQLKAWAQ